MLKPALFARYVDVSRIGLGPFDQYRTIVCWLIVAFGAVVAINSLQRPPGGGGRPKRAPPVTFAPAEAQSPPLHMDDPEPEEADGDETLGAGEDEDHDQAADGLVEAHEPEQFRRKALSPSPRTPQPLW